MYKNSLWWRFDEKRPAPAHSHFVRVEKILGYTDLGLYLYELLTTLIFAGGSAGPPSGFVTVPGKPSMVFHVSAVDLSRVPRARICAWTLLQRVLAAALALHTLVSWSQIRLVMMSGLSIRISIPVGIASGEGTS